jgi:hypothetical protein
MSGISTPGTGGKSKSITNSAPQDFSSYNHPQEVKLAMTGYTWGSRKWDDDSLTPCFF